VQIHHGLADGQAEPQSPKLLVGFQFPLLESDEETRNDLRIDANARIAHLYPYGTGVGGETANHDDAPLRGELGGVFEEVPEHLLKASRVAVDVVFGGGQLQADENPFGLYFRAADLQNIPDNTVQIPWLDVQFDFATDQAVQVEQVVDQASLQFQIAANR